MCNEQVGVSLRRCYNFRMVARVFDSQRVRGVDRIPRNWPRKISATLATTLCLGMGTSADCARYYVDWNANGAQTGVDWKNAFAHPNQAFAIATSGDEVWIAEGTYHPGAPGNSGASFVVPAGVKVYGGFQGVESSLANRQWWIHRTVFSGDLADDDQFGNPWYSGWNINSPTANTSSKFWAGPRGLCSMA